MGRVVESMTRMQVNSCIIRVWRDESHVCGHYDNSDLHNLLPTAQFERWTMAQIAEAFAKVSRVNAVEVTSKATGEGVLIYPDWP